MREIIQKVVAAEGEAKRLVQAARAEADRLVADARAQARQLLEQAQRDARLEAETLLAAAEIEAAREKAEQLDRVRAEINATVRLDEKLAQAAVAATVRQVCGLPPTGTPEPLAAGAARHP